MLIAEARVETERSSRYLVQLCQHVSKVAQGHSPMRARVEWSDDRGVIDFGAGRCTLRAEPSGLTLRVEASDAESLRMVEQRIADRLERFGKRDRLTVSWTTPQDAAEASAETLPGRRSEGRHTPEPPRYPTEEESVVRGSDGGAAERTRRWPTILGIVIAIAVLGLIVFLHLSGAIGPGAH
jgi:hypothetical protein